MKGKMEKEYNMRDVLNAVDIPRERFKEWIAKGFIKASIQESQGEGARMINKYSLDDVYKIAIFKEMIKLLKRKTASKIIYGGKMYTEYKIIFHLDRIKKNVKEKLKA